jgi:acetyl-CoA carboxylase biotin carboxyl carrier protein
MKAAFDPDIVRSLASILTETGLTEIEVSHQDSRIRVVRAAAAVAAPMQLAPVAAPLVAAPVMEDTAPHPGTVTSPMVGVAYLSPEPSAPHFVSPGQQVSAGQTLLLIEAMKTFNQVKAPKAGTVIRVLVASGAPVEFGEPLLVIE